MVEVLSNIAGVFVIAVICYTIVVGIILHTTKDEDDKWQTLQTSYL